MKTRIIEEIISGETRSEIMMDGNFPLLYFVDLKQKKNINLDINIRLNSYDNSILENDFEIRGLLLDKDLLERKMRGESIPDENQYIFPGQYIPSYKIGFLQINKEMNNSNTNFILIQINSKKQKKIETYFLVETLANDHPEVYFMPINKYFIDNFNITENTTRTQNKYYLDFNDKYDEETKKNDSVLIEFSPNYNDLELIFDDNNIVYTKKIVTGFQKYRIISSSSGNIFYNVLNKNNRKKVNYIIRYYYSEEAKEYNYIFDYNYKVENIPISTDPNNSKLKLIFNKIDILTNNTHFIPKEGNIITFEIYASLFEKDDGELLNSSALIYNKPSYETKTLHKYNEEDTFCLLFEKIPNDIKTTLKLRLGINVIIEQNIFNEEFLAYSLEIDLKKKDNENEGDKGNDNLTIIISIVASVVVGLIIFSIICFFRIRKLKRNNSELQEKVLSTKFAAGREENVLIKEVKTKREQDYETTFI